MIRVTVLLVCLFFTIPAYAQYNDSAGESIPKLKRSKGTKLSESKTRKAEVQKAKPDKYGNAGGPQYDLAYDGAFEGQTILVVMLVPWGRFDDARTALATKGFGVAEFRDLPSPKRLRELLGKANQFWLISSCGETNGQLTEAHVKEINTFFKEGHGVYLWGDNDPCNEEANYVSKRVLDVEMSGDLPGDKVVTFKTKKNKSGLLRDHLISTGIENLYEGVTVASIKLDGRRGAGPKKQGAVKPFLWGSDGGVIAAFFDHDGRRAIVDGGMTRLYNRWDTAGTGRYVVNAAAWLANAERFGSKIVKKKPIKSKKP